MINNPAVFETAHLAPIRKYCEQHVCPQRSEGLAVSIVPWNSFCYGRLQASLFPPSPLPAPTSPRATAQKRRRSSTVSQRFLNRIRGQGTLPGLSHCMASARNAKSGFAQVRCGNEGTGWHEKLLAHAGGCLRKSERPTPENPTLARPFGETSILERVLPAELDSRAAM